jgi:hypothetical protein
MGYNRKSYDCKGAFLHSPTRVSIDLVVIVPAYITDKIDDNVKEKTKSTK